MKEIYEFRVPVSSASFLPDDVGERDGSVVIVRCEAGDALMDVLREEDQRQRNTEDGAAFLGWEVRREYSQTEISNAELFSVVFESTFEPSGEECGTVYDDTLACGHEFEPVLEVDIGGHSVKMGPATCGAGFRQLSALKLRQSSIPEGMDFARTIADEIVISRRAVDVFQQAGLTGAEFQPVEASSRSRPVARLASCQLRVSSDGVSVHPSTRAGENPFDRFGFGRCPQGHTLGLNLLSDVRVERASLSNVDILATRQLVGWRVGLLRPAPVILFSPRTRAVVLDAGLMGLRFEVAGVL